MKNVKELELSLESNHFHPLNFLVPSNIRPIKPYEIMLDGTVVSVYSFYSESQEKELFLKISTNEKRQYNENLTYMMDNLPDCILKKYNSFSFAGKDGKTYYYSVFQMIDCTLDDFISERLENCNFDEICPTKNTVNPSLINCAKTGAWKSQKPRASEPFNFTKDDDGIKEDEMLYLWREIIHAFADLQKARICHRDIRPDNIAIVPADENDASENRKSDYTSFNAEQKYTNYSKYSRGSGVSYDRNTNPDSTGAMSVRGKSMRASLRQNFSNERPFKPNFEKSVSKGKKHIKFK